MTQVITPRNTKYQNITLDPPFPCLDDTGNSSLSFGSDTKQNCLLCIHPQTFTIIFRIVFSFRFHHGVRS
jgi:hypothetical protein